MRHGQRDGNHRAIARGLREAGCSVAETADLGDGFPDLVVALRLRTVLMEVKNPAWPPSKRKLRPNQAAFRETWKGEIYTVETLEEAVGIMFRGPGPG